MNGRGAWMVLAALVWADPVWGQQTGVVAVGGSATLVAAPDASVEGLPRFGPLIRYGESEEGWGTRLGFNWYTVDVEAAAGQAVDWFGHVRIRPLMAGYGYTHLFGPVAASGNVLVGYAFTSAGMRRPFAERYQEATGGANVRSSVANIFVLKPEVSAWIDVTETLGLNVSLGYMIARPTLVIDSTAGRDRQPVRADVVMLKVGLVYAIF